ncbi:MAG: hypothetical protein LBI30_03395 [Holosporales bacterium]|jgi:hypothetical protein|nr:hypothetical protein [Holosporales bacterium]
MNKKIALVSSLVVAVGIISSQSCQGGWFSKIKAHVSSIYKTHIKPQLEASLHEAASKGAEALHAHATDVVKHFEDHVAETANAVAAHHGFDKQ